MNKVNVICLGGRITKFDTRTFKTGKTVTVVKFAHEIKGKEYEIEVRTFRSIDNLSLFGIHEGTECYITGKLDVNDYKNVYGGVSRKFSIIANDITTIKTKAEVEAEPIPTNLKKPKPTPWSDYEGNPYAPMSDQAQKKYELVQKIKSEQEKEKSEVPF